jgi:hypothetical protein
MTCGSDQIRDGIERYASHDRDRAEEREYRQRDDEHAPRGRTIR